MTRFDVARTRWPKSTVAYGSLRIGPPRNQLKRTIGMLPTPDNSECSRHKNTGAHPARPSETEAICAAKRGPASKGPVRRGMRRAGSRVVDSHPQLCQGERHESCSADKSRHPPDGKNPGGQTPDGQSSDGYRPDGCQAYGQSPAFAPMRRCADAPMRRCADAPMSARARRIGQEAKRRTLKTSPGPSQAARKARGQIS